MAEQLTDERAPLLDREAQVEAGEAPIPTPPQEKRTWWTVAWYIVFALFGVLVVAVFVKGIVDSDDVDVSLSFYVFSAGCVSCVWIPGRVSQWDLRKCSYNAYYLG